jgi:hypothetical protein
VALIAKAMLLLGLLLIVPARADGPLTGVPAVGPWGGQFLWYPDWGFQSHGCCDQMWHTFFGSGAIPDSGYGFNEKMSPCASGGEKSAKMIDIFTQEDRLRAAFAKKGYNLRRLGSAQTQEKAAELIKKLPDGSKVAMYGNGNCGRNAGWTAASVKDGKLVMAGSRTAIDIANKADFFELYVADPIPAAACPPGKPCPVSLSGQAAGAAAGNSAPPAPAGGKTPTVAAAGKSGGIGGFLKSVGKGLGKAARIAGTAAGVYQIYDAYQQPDATPETVAMIGLLTVSTSDVLTNLFIGYFAPGCHYADAHCCSECTGRP